jgi:hypothetical protein
LSTWRQIQEKDITGICTSCTDTACKEIDSAKRGIKPKHGIDYTKEVVQSNQCTAKKRRKEREEYTDSKLKLLLPRYNFINPKKEYQIGK